MLGRWAGEKLHRGWGSKEMAKVVRGPGSQSGSPGWYTDHPSRPNTSGLWEGIPAWRPVRTRYLRTTMHLPHSRTVPEPPPGPDIIWREKREGGEWREAPFN